MEKDTLPLAHVEEDNVAKPIAEKLDEEVCLKNSPKFKEDKERMVDKVSVSKLDDHFTRSDSEIRY